MRRFLLLLTPLLFALPAAGIAADDDGEAAPEKSRTVVSLEDRLSTGLKVRRPQDVEWVEHVAEMVRVGRLPAKVVDSTYLWAIRRRQSHPFPAFQKALRLQAEVLGIDVD